MYPQPMTCADVRRYYTRRDFLDYLFRVLSRRPVVLCAASEPQGRYQQCRPRLTAASVDVLKDQIAAWLDRAFTGLGPDEALPAYPSLHYAVGRHWSGARDWIIESDADTWQDAWRAIEPVVGLMDALEIPFTLRYTGHCSPHLCLAEEDFPEPVDLLEALRISQELTGLVRQRVNTLIPPNVRAHIDLAGAIARLPYTLNENTGFACIVIPPSLYGAFDPSLAHPDRVEIAPMWPPDTRSDRATRLIEWAEGQRDIHAAPLSLFSRSATTVTPPMIQIQRDTQTEYTRLRVSLLPKMKPSSPPPANMPEPPEGMVFVPAGPFISGAPWRTGDHRFYDLTEPMMAIAETDAYFIDIHPVTNAQYAAFIRDGGYERSALWSAQGWAFVQACRWTGPGVPCEGVTSNLPVGGISCFEAEAWARWSGKRLPTSLEWEKACRGPDGRRWSWGDTFDITRCNTADRFGPDEAWVPTPVGMFPAGASPYGCLDMIGNVWEWVQEEMVFGGSFDSHFLESSCCDYHGQEPHYRPSKVGFRCVTHLNAAV